MPQGKPIEKDLSSIVDRAAKDPAFRREIEKDPLGAAHKAGFRLTWDEIRQATGLKGTDEEVHKQLLAAIHGKCTTTISW
jgi:hypothetical protein